MKTWLPVSALLVCCVGCANSSGSVADAFPRSNFADPWVLDGEVWSGTFAEAVDALGDDAVQWEHFEPTHVWLAVYRHDSRAERQTVRGFAFANDEAARRAYDHFKPLHPESSNLGDEGCWTDDGTMFVWRRLVFEVFGDGSSAGQLQAFYLAAFIEQSMPDGVPDAPK